MWWSTRKRIDFKTLTSKFRYILYLNFDVNVLENVFSWWIITYMTFVGKGLLFNRLTLTRWIRMTSVITNDCSIPATFVAGIEQSLVITLVIRIQRVKVQVLWRQWFWEVSFFYPVSFMSVSNLNARQCYNKNLDWISSNFETLTW